MRSAAAAEQEDALLALPDFVLGPDGSIGRAFIAAGTPRFRDAAAYVRRLPYGRPAADGVLAVLESGRGTCSSKHALVARLAREHGWRDIELCVGVFEMREANTPGVGPVLAAHELDRAPEAHCWLRYRGERVDLTGLPAGMESPFEEILEERTADPDELMAQKVAWHRAFTARWAAARGLDLDRVWTAREACIAALADRWGSRD